MGFYQEIRNIYGMYATKLMKQWANMNRKLVKYRNRRNFLLRCRRAKILPRHICDSIKSVESLLIAGSINTFTNRIDNFIYDLEFRILSLEIRTTCDTISRFQRYIVDIQNKLKDIVPSQIFTSYQKRIELTYSKLYKKIKHNNISKYNRLTERSITENVLFHDNTKWFKNISSLDIPTEISRFLSLGPKFSVPTVKGDFRLDRFLADTENIINETPDTEKDILRARTTNIVTNYLQYSRNNSSSNLNVTFKKTRTFLREHPEIYILQSDKGGCTVAMDKAEYISKTETLLLDKSTYSLINRDPTATIQTKHNNLIKTIKRKKELTDLEAKQLTIYNSVSPKLYCLPKTHKPGIPLRPIVSSINATTYNISKFLSNILDNSFRNDTDYNVKDSFSFVNNIKNMVLPVDHVLISLDVVSLFTNIPLRLVSDILDEKWNQIEIHTTLSKTSFLRLIDFIFDNTYFGFNDKFYRQTFGTPMGSPISPILAKIVLDHLLNTVLPLLPFKVPFIYKYVDDIICSIPAEYKQLTLDVFNSFNKKIQFTIETEIDRSVPFLDTKVIRNNDNKIILNWYQKPTDSNRFLNFFSNHPSKQKYNTVIAMRNRVTHISDESFLQSNLKKLFDIFQNNGYPKHILKKLIFNSNLSDGSTDKGDTTIKYKKLPYISGLTDKMVSVFKNYSNIRIAKYNNLCISSLFSHVKQSTPLMYNSNVVYRMSCLECDKSYIGQTSQWLKQRLTQHKSDCMNGKKSCAAVDHHLRTGHQFDFKNVKILEHENNYKKRLFLEMVHIKKEKNSINYKTDTNNLSNMYCGILSNVELAAQLN